MRLGCIADDFTGAGDIANTLSGGGMRTRLFIGAAAVDSGCDAGVDSGCDAGVDGGCDAGVVALKTRSIPAADAVAQSLTALAALRAAGAEQIVFKYCSTFDSTRAGNIGPVAEALAAALGARGVVVCPAFPATGRTVYQGHLFVGDRLLNETGMAAHPLTPMTDPDIRRWLGHQTAEAPGHVGLATVRAGSAAIRAALAASAAVLVVVDAASEDDLRAIAAAVAGAPLVTGASGVAIGLPANFGVRGGRPARAAIAADGPALLLAGSCSTTTQAQVAAYTASNPAFEVDIERLLNGEPVLDEALVFAAAHAAPLIYSTAAPDRVAAAQARHGEARAAAAVETLFGALARAGVMRGVRRLVVAGGETSGAVVGALELAGLDVGAEIAPGVPMLGARLADGSVLALELKSGNFGAPDFLARAVRMLGGE